MSISFHANTRASRLFAAITAALMFPVTAFAQVAPPMEGAKVTDLTKVEVPGTRDAEQAERALTPGAVNVVDGETFYQRSVTNMADSLRFVPGLWTESTTGGDAIFISSRGSNLDATDYDSNGIKLFQDGLPVTTADGNNHNRFIDPMGARFVTVARGANALTYGASTLGGAIDFASPTARNSAPFQIFLSGGSFDAYSARLSAAKVYGDLDGLVTLEAKRRDGYRAHSQQERFGLSANAGWQVSDAVELRFFANHIDNHEELAGALTRAQFETEPTQANPSAITGNFQLNVKTDRVAGKGTWEIDANSRMEFGLSYEDQNLYHPIVDKVLVDFDGPGPNPPVEVFSLLKNTDQRTFAGMMRYNVKRGNHDVLAGINLANTHEQGVNFRNNGGQRNGKTGTIDNRSTSAELFLVDRWKIAPRWTLVYGAQGVLTSRDVRNVDLASGILRNPNQDYASFNPRLGAIYALNQNTEAFASASRLFEAPTTFELQDDVRGNNATLDAMHGTVYEIGLRGATPSDAARASWHWDASLYYAQIRDEILSIDDPLAPGTSLSTNIDRTTHAGAEALVGASVPFSGGRHRIEPLISATYNAFHFDGDRLYGNNRLPAAPDYALRGEVMYRNDRGFFAGPTFDVVGARYADFSNSYRIAGYHLVGLRAGTKRNRWELFGEVHNMLGKDYVGAISVRDRAGAQDAILQPGAPRSLNVGIRVQF